MLTRIHGLAALLATLTIAIFFCATLAAELFGATETVATVKALIVAPGLFVLVPAIAATGASGFFLARQRRGGLAATKLKRMRFIGANGLLVLVPCALLLDRWAAAGAFGSAFWAVQVLELAAGAANLALMGLNLRDGLRMTGRWLRR